MSIYFVKIQPERNFFFGIEPSGRAGAYGNSKTYFLKGMELPQQTSVFGLIRYVLLLEMGIIREGMPNIPYDKREAAAQLIGKASFRPDITEYGILKKLYPVFFTSTRKGDFTNYFR